MKIKDGLKKGLSVLEIIIMSTMPVLFNKCTKSKQEVADKYFEPRLPITVYVEAQDSQTFRMYAEPINELKAQARSVDVDLIDDVEVCDKNYWIHPTQGFIVRERSSKEQFWDCVVDTSKGEIYIRSDLEPREKGTLVKEEVMKQILGTSDSSDDLTFGARGQFEYIPHRELSEDELYKLAEKYGTVKVPKK